MATVVIIHAAEDALPARALAEKLRGANLTPVIEVPPGEDLRAAISGAPVTMALWSPRSSSQQGLIDETNFARTRSKVVHARMQNTPTPSAFSGDPSIDLTGWRGEDDFPAWRELATAVTQFAGVPLPPPAPPKGPASFFSPGRPPDANAAPPPRPAPAQRAPQQARPPAPPRPAATAPPPRSAPAPAGDDSPKKGFPLVPVIIAAVLLIGGVGGYFVWTNMQGSQVAAAWDDVPRNDARALRDFLADNPGSHRQEAEQALIDLEEQSFDAAQEEDTIEAFETFLNEFPESDHAIAARGRIAELRSMSPVEDTTIDPLGDPFGDTTTLADPDLLPPTTEPLPDSSGEGPAALTPQEPDPSQGPAELAPPPG